MLMKKNVALGISIICSVFLVVLGTYSYIRWSGVNQNTAINFVVEAGLQEYIEYDPGNSQFAGDFKVVSSYDQGIYSTVTVNKKALGAHVNLIATLKMTVNEIGVNMSKYEGIKWTVTSKDCDNSGSSGTEEICASGNFLGVSGGDELILMTNIELTTVPKEYTVWLWADRRESPTSSMIHEKIDTEIWMEIEQEVVETCTVTQINATNQTISATGVCPSTDISKYAVTTSSSSPTYWMDIASADQNNIYNLITSQTTTGNNAGTSITSVGTYYVWFQSTTGQTFYDQVSVTNIDTVGPTCTFISAKDTIYSGETTTIKLQCIDTNNKIVVTDTNKIELSEITKTANSSLLTINSISEPKSINNGVEYTINVTGASGNGTVTLTLPAASIANNNGIGNAIATGTIAVKNTFTISYYNCNGTGFSGTFTNATPSSYIYGTVATLSTPAYTGYTFKNYYTTPECDGYTVSNISTKDFGDKKLYAKWEANTYSINYELHGGTAGASAPQSAKYDSVITISNPTKSGYAFKGWTATNITPSTAKYGSTNNPTTSWNGTTYVTSQYFKNLRSDSGTATLAANWEYSALFYYWNGSAIASKTVTCTGTTNCTITIPTEVTGSTGQRSGTYSGLATSVGTMATTIARTTTSITLSSNMTYYAVYRKDVTVAYPTSTSAATSTTWYRNEYFTSTSAVTSKLSNTTSGTTNATSSNLNNLFGTFKGLATAVNTTTATTIDTAATQSDTAYYAVTTSNITATFYYWQTSAITSSTASGTRTNYCTSATAAAVSHGSITPPVTITSLTSQYGATGIGWATAVNTMSTTSPTTGYTSYYAVYRGNVTIAYPTSTSVSTTTTWYRNAFFTSNSAMSTVLAASNSSTASATSSNLSNLYGTFVGLSSSTTLGTNSSIANAAKTTTTTFYAVTTSNVTATFYYWGSSSVTSSTASGTRTNYSTGTSTAAVSHGSITPPVTITSRTGQYGSAGIGWATSTSTMTKTNSITTANTAYYAIYSNAVKIYYPSTTSAATNTTWYRNEYLTSTTAITSTMSTASTSLSTVTPTVVSGYSLVGFATGSNTSSAGYTTPDSLATLTGTTYYQIIKKVVSATFYYQSNKTGGSFTSANTTSSATRYVYCSNTTTSTVSNANIPIPSAVSSSVGKYNAAYVGVASAVNTMTTSTPTTATESATYYAVYSTSVKVYYPTSTTAASNVTWYRNEYFTSNSAMSTILSTAANSTTSAASSNLSSLYGTFKGLATAVSNATTSTIAAAATSTTTTFYAVTTSNISATFYYWGSSAITSGTASGTRTNWCTGTTTAGVSHGAITAPVTITSQTSQYGATGIGWATATGTMATTSPTTANTTYYAVYRKNVTIYYPTSVSAATNVTWYRNAYFTSTTAMSTVLSTSVTGTSNATTVSGIYGTYKGLATAVNNTTTITISAAATTTTTAFYAVSSDTITATFYYWGTSAITNKTANGTRTVYCTSATASTVSHGAITAPVTITSQTSQYGATGIGWASAVNTMATTSPTTANTTYYAVYRKNVTIYYPTSTTAATSVTWYRNAYFTSATAMSTVLSTSNTGTSNATTVSGIHGTFKGLATAVNNTTTSTIAAAATSTGTSFYAVSTTAVTATFYYWGSSAVTSKTATGSITNYCTSATAATISHGSITPPVTITSLTSQYGATGIGWATAVNTMSTVSPTTANTTYYAVYRKDVKIYYPTSTSAATNVTWYRNAYFTSATAMSTVLSTSNTGTSNATTVSGILDTYKGLATSTSTATTITIAAAATNTATSFYAVSTSSITATFYYWGSGSVTSGTANGTRTNWCTGTATAGVSHGAITAPVTITSQTSQYGATGIGWATAVNTMTTVSPTTANTTYYAVYRQGVTVYYPTSVSAATNVTWYRNAFFTGTTAMSTVLSTGTSGTSNATTVSGILGTFKGLATAANTTTTSTVAAATTSTGTTFYAVSTSNITATFYYWGTSSVTNGTASGTRTNYCTGTASATVSHGAITPPVTITSRTGQYSSTGIGWATAVNTMTTVSPTTANTTYYAVYSKAVKIYYPTSTTAATNTTWYRNEYLTSTSAITSVMSSSSTSLSSPTASVVSGYSLSGFATGSNSTSVSLSSIAALATATGTTYYQIVGKAVSATIYYQSSGTAGTCNVTSAAASGNKYLYCTSTSAATVSDSNITIPSTVSSSVGKYNSPYIGVASSTGTMATMTPTTATSGGTYYAVYRQGVTNYYYNSSYTNRTLYRNEWLTSTSACSTPVLSTSSTGTTNYSTAAGPGSSEWAGLANSSTATAATYTSVSAAAQSTETTLYTYYRFNVNYAKGANVSAIGATSGSCLVTTSKTSCSVTLPSITANTNYTPVGWNTTSGATTGTAAGSAYTLSSNGTTLYANAQKNRYVVNYYLGNGTSTAGSTFITSTTCEVDTNCALTTWANLGATFPGSTNKWAFAGWSTSETDPTITYTNGQTINRTATTSINLYAVGSRTFEFYSGNAPTSGTTQTQRWIPYSTAATYATSITVPELTSLTTYGWTALGYRANDTPEASVTISTTGAYKPGVASLTSMVFRGKYSRSGTVSYNGNSSTSGSTAGGTYTQYYSSGYASGGANTGAKTSTMTFSLATNGFSRTYYTFSKWADGSTSGTQYAAGASYSWNPAVNSTATSKTFYAIWNGNQYTITYYLGSTSAGTSTCNYNSSCTLTTWANLNKTFTNSSSGWGYVGWATANNTTATSTTYTNGKTFTYNVGGNLDLYAVGSRSVVFISGDAGATSSTVTQYWNPAGTTNGTHLSSVSSPAITSISGWSTIGFRNDTTATATSEYAASSTVYPASGEAATLYAIYSRSHTASFYSGTNAQAARSENTAYYNSSAASKPTTVTVTAPTAAVNTNITSWTELGYRDDTTAGAAELSYGATATLTFGTTYNYYSVYSRSHTATFYSGVNKSGTKTASNTAYYNSGSTGSLPTSVVVTAPTAANNTDISGWTEKGFRDDTNELNTVELSYGGTATLTFGTAYTYYSLYYKSSTATYYSGVNNSESYWQASTKLYNSNTASLPTTVIMYAPSADKTLDIENWTELGFRDDTTAGAAELSYGGTFTITIGTEPVYYTVYSRVLTISYNGNGNTGGSTANTTSTIYLNANSTTTSSQAVTLAANGFTKTNYSFSKWAAGSTSGTQYAAGASYNPNLAYNATTFGTTMYAIWNANTYTVNYYLGNGTGTAGSTLLSSSTCTRNTNCTLTTFANLGGTFPGSTYKWGFGGWSTSETDPTITYTDGGTVNRSATTALNLYAVGTRTFYFYSGLAPTSSSGNQTQRWIPYSTATTYSTSITVPELTSLTSYGWTPLGYRASTDVTASVTLAVGTQNPSPSSFTELGFRGKYSRSLILSYDGNGATSGSTTSSTATQYYNSGVANDGINTSSNTSTVTYTIAANGFTNTGYSFTKWADGSTSGTQYSAGASYTWNPAVDSSATTKTMYALWEEGDSAGPSIEFNPEGKTTAQKSHTSTISVTDESGVSSIKYVWSTSASASASSGTATSSGAALSKSGVTGTYYLCVYAEDTNGNSSNECSGGFVFDNTAPTITGDTTKCVLKGQTFSADAHFAVSDTNGYTTSVSGSVNTGATGTYTTSLIATDVAGNSATKSVTVYVYTKISSDGTVSSGAGLYADGFNAARYIYVGADPNNYVSFNGELWRIVSIEADGAIKLVDYSFSKTYAYSSSTKTYSGTFSRTKLYTYLNDTYYSGTLNATARGQIQQYAFNTGTVSTGSSSTAITSTYAKEKAVQTSMYVGILNITDYARASTNCYPTSTTWATLNNTSSPTCRNNNWLRLNTNYNYYVFLNPSSATETRQMANGYIAKISPSVTQYIYPTVYLKNTTTFMGAGTSSNPYTICTNCNVNVGCTLQTSAGYATSKTLTITTSSSDVTYSFDGSTYNTTKTKSVSSAGTYAAYVKSAAGIVGSCSLVLKSKTQYQHLACTTCNTCYYCSSGTYCDMGMSNKANGCHSGEISAGNGDQYYCTDSLDGAWNPCNSKCYSSYSASAVNGKNCSKCACKTWESSPSDTTWHDNSAGTSNYSSTKNYTSRTVISP